MWSNPGIFQKNSFTLPVIGTKFRLGGNHEIITDESVLTVIFNNSGEAGAENKTRKEEIRILKIRAAP